MRKNAVHTTARAIATIMVIALMTAMSCITTSCTKEKSQAQLRSAIMQLRRELPIESPYGEMTDARYDSDSNCVRMVIKATSPELIDVYKGFGGIKLDYKKRFKLLMGSEQMRDVIQLMSDAEAALSISIRDNFSLPIVEITLDADDIHECANSNLSQTEIIRALTADEIESYRSLWPMEVDNGISITGMDYDRDNECIIIKYHAEGDNYDFNGMTQETFKETMKLMFVSDELNFLNEYITTGNLNVRIETTDTNGKAFTATFTAEEIADLQNLQLTEKDIARSILKNQTDSERSSYPQSLGTGLTATDSYIEGDNYYYLVTVDDDLYDIDSYTSKESRDMCITGIRQEPEAVELLREANLNIVYKYKGKHSGRTVTVTINSFEL